MKASYHTLASINQLLSLAIEHDMMNTGPHISISLDQVVLIARHRTWHDEDWTTSPSASINQSVL